MFQRDYILRMIEMISDLIAGILGLVRKGKYQEAEESLDQAYLDFLKEDAAFFQAIPKEKLTEELLGKHHYTSGHLEVLSELFFAQAELFYAQGHLHESMNYYERCLLLTEFVVKESKVYSVQKQNRIDELKARIASLNVQGPEN